MMVITRVSRAQFLMCLSMVLVVGAVYHDYAEYIL